MSNRTEDVANKGKIADLVVKFVDFAMNIINPPRFRIKVQRADLTCDVIKKVAQFVLSKL